MRRVLIIRQEEEALPLAKQLQDKGIDSSVFPLFRPQFLPCPQLEAPQGLIITSKNALRALEKREDLKTLPLYAVGDKTAEFAKTLGFTQVLTASGNNTDLSALVLKKTSPENGILWYLSGNKIKGNLIETLTKAGFSVRRHVVYELEEVKELPLPLIAALQENQLTHVLFFSPHTTSLFIRLLRKANLDFLTPQMISLCLSRDVLNIISGLHWKKAWVSPSPTLRSILDYFNEEK